MKVGFTGTQRGMSDPAGQEGGQVMNSSSPRMGPPAVPASDFRSVRPTDRGAATIVAELAAAGLANSSADAEGRDP